MKLTLLLPLLTTLAATVPAAHAAATNAPARPATNAPAAPRQLDFDSFKLITDRNIFNGNRSGQRIVARGVTQRAIKVDSLTLVGTLSSERGDLAFFDGTESNYRKAVKLESNVAGFVLKEIWPNGVKLVDGTNEIALRIGTALRREDEGHWRYAEAGNYSSGSGSSGSFRAASYGSGRAANNERSTESATGSSSSPTPAAPAADVNEVLRKLMEKREKDNQ